MNAETSICPICGKAKSANASQSADACQGHGEQGASLVEMLNAIPTPSVGAPKPGQDPARPASITNSGMDAQPGAIVPPSQAQGADVPQWMKNYNSYSGTSGTTPAADPYRQQSPMGDTVAPPPGGYNAIMVVMIIACLALFGYLYINKDKVQPMPAEGTQNTSPVFTPGQSPVPGAAPVTPSSPVPGAQTTAAPAPSAASPTPPINPAPGVNGNPAPDNINVGQPVPQIIPQGGQTGTLQPSNLPLGTGNTYPTATPDPNAVPNANPAAPAAPGAAPGQ